MKKNRLFFEDLSILATRRLSCLVLVLLLLLKTFFVCPPACRRRLFLLKTDINFFCVPSGLPQAPFLAEKLHFLKSDISYIAKKTFFVQKSSKTQLLSS